MLISLEQLIDPNLKVYVQESKQNNAARATANNQQQQDLTNATVLNELRIARNKSIKVPDREVSQRDVQINGRSVPVRIIYPKKVTPKGVFLEIHGGGFYLDKAARSDVSNTRLADALKLVVVSIDYRLAPEHPWPAAPDDCATAALWLIDNARSEFGTSELFIGGASAGATLAVTTMLRLRECGFLKAFHGAVLQYGAYDLSGQTPGGRLYMDEYFIKAYVGGVKDRTVPDISPLFGDLKQFPPVLMLVGTLDILLEDNLAMCARLTAAGNKVDLRVYPESEHGFISRSTKMSTAAAKDINAWLMHQLRQRRMLP